MEKQEVNQVDVKSMPVVKMARVEEEDTVKSIRNGLDYLKDRTNEKIEWNKRDIDRMRGDHWNLKELHLSLDKKVSMLEDKLFQLAIKNN